MIIAGVTAAHLLDGFDDTINRLPVIILSLLRPEVGTQPQFKKKKPPKTYRYDSSLSPALDWDGQNPAQEVGEWLLNLIEQAVALPAPHKFASPQELKREDGQVVATVRGLADAVEQLKRLGQPFLNWAGKAERLSFDVPTLPLFIHERLSTKGIIETLKGHRKSRMEQMDLFGDPQHSITDQVLKAYEYRDKWVNRLILGDSLVVMNSLLHYEGLGGKKTREASWPLPRSSLLGFLTRPRKTPVLPLRPPTCRP